MFKPKDYFRFSISTLLLVLTLVALVLLANERNRKIIEVEKLKERTEELVWESRVQSRLISILAMDPKNEHDRQAVDLAEVFANPVPFQTKLSRIGSIREHEDAIHSHVKLIDADRDAGGLEILFLSKKIDGMSLLTLFDDDRLIETLALNQRAFECTHEFMFEDTNNDGVIDVRITETGAIRQLKYQLAVRRSGFTYIGEDGTEVSTTDRH